MFHNVICQEIKKESIRRLRHLVHIENQMFFFLCFEYVWGIWGQYVANKCPVSTVSGILVDYNCW